MTKPAVFGAAEPEDMRPDSVVPVELGAIKSRVAALRPADTKVEYHKYPRVGHGFGLGNGTGAQEWIADAVRFRRARARERYAPCACFQNIVFEFAEEAGIRWSTSQCSTILPSSSSRKMSMPAQFRFIAGTDAIAGAEQKIADLTAQIEANRELSTSFAFD